MYITFLWNKELSFIARFSSYLSVFVEKIWIFVFCGGFSRLFTLSDFTKKGGWCYNNTVLSNHRFRKAFI